MGGYGIIWNDDLDLSCDELFENGKTFSPSLTSAWLYRRYYEMRIWKTERTYLKKRSGTKCTEHMT